MGKELDPGDRDKLYQVIKYWIVELGELGATLKKDQDKLKQFVTEPVDELRLHYATAPVTFPRMTSFIGTVNNDEFLKDETGSRRYWVIPLNDLDFNIIDTIDMQQLWGEVMHMWKDEKEVFYLNKDDLKELHIHNEEFTTKSLTFNSLEFYFDWDAPIDKWRYMKSSDISMKLNMKASKTLKTDIEKLGGQYIRKKASRGYVMPPLKTEFQYL